jgi:hypothetical protein
VGLAALREAASTDVADTLVRGLGVVQSEGPDRALFVMPHLRRVARYVSALVDALDNFRTWLIGEAG